MRATSDPTSGQTTIHVKLMDEGTDVWRPVPAVDLGDGWYRLLATDHYGSDNEAWEFPPGSTVGAEPKALSGGTVLVATRRFEG